MTFEQAIATQPVWIFWWLNWMLVGVFAPPLVLLIWQQSRMAAVISIIANVAAGLGVVWIFNQLGYVKLMGITHVLLWTPLAIYLFKQIKRPDMPKWPRLIIGVMFATIMVSLAFDYVDVLRYILGERSPLV
jgi:hypothetical protein